MSISPELEKFYGNWMSKADGYIAQETKEYFDEFFTLYVLFNRLYAEATFRLARNDQVQLQNRNSFPDSNAAQEYLLQYLSARTVCLEIDNNSGAHKALNDICSLLRRGDFAFKLDMVTGEVQPEKDGELLKQLESTNKGIKAKAVLETIYSIRCNLFHGHKGFTSVQEEILRPMNLLLRTIINITYKRLCTTIGLPNTSADRD